MAQVVIPNRPAGTDLRSIEAIIADFDAITAQVNGNIDDTNLKSPMAAKRQLLLESSGTVGNGFSYNTAGQDFLLCMATTSPLQSGATPPSQAAIPLWLGDTSYDGQGTDFVVPNKTSYCRVKVVYTTLGTIPPAINISTSLYAIVGVSGGYLFNLVAGSTATVRALTALGVFGDESAQFAMPTSAAAYALGVNISGGGGSLASRVDVSAQLYGYNA